MGVMKIDLKVLQVRVRGRVGGIGVRGRVGDGEAALQAVRLRVRVRVRASGVPVLQEVYRKGSRGAVEE